MMLKNQIKNDFSYFVRVASAARLFQRFMMSGMSFTSRFWSRLPLNGGVARISGYSNFIVLIMAFFSFLGTFFAYAKNRAFRGYGVLRASGASHLLRNHYNPLSLLNAE